MEKQNNHIDRRGFLKLWHQCRYNDSSSLWLRTPELKAAKDGMPPLLFRQTR